MSAFVNTESKITLITKSTKYELWNLYKIQNKTLIYYYIVRFPSSFVFQNFESVFGMFGIL